MIKISDIELYVGTKEEYYHAFREGINIVCALNRANGYVTHQSVVGWSGRGCNKDNPYYLFKQEENAIYLNMIDGDNPAYVSDEMINAALEFIHEKLQKGSKVFIYCSLGESRSPSVALMYLLEYGLIEKNDQTIQNFRTTIYQNFFPKLGNLKYIQTRWGI